MPLIELKNISQTREKKDILKDINISIDRGEVFAMIGPTGAGKTTLLRIIDMLDNPSRGEVLYDGNNVASSEKSRLDVRRRMAFVLQKPVVFNTSVYENVAYGLKWRRIDKLQLRDKVNAILEATQLTDYSQRNARTLSGGEMQRVAIARSLMSTPRVLFADEPTGNLDSQTGSEIMEMLHCLNRQHGLTIVMVTHDLALAGQADALARLENGRLVND